MPDNVGILSPEAEQLFRDDIENYCHQRQIAVESTEAKLLTLALHISWDIKPYKIVLRYPETVFLLAVLVTLQMLKWPAGTGEEWIVRLVSGMYRQVTYEQAYSEIRNFRYLSHVADLTQAICEYKR